MSFRLNLDDLNRILANIRIAERHVQSGYTVLVDEAGNPLHNLAPFGLRTVSGQYNNLLYIDYGTADQPMPRLLTPEFRAAETNPRTGQATSYAQTAGSVYDSEPRTISNLVSDQSVNNPAVFVAAFVALGSSDPYGDAARYTAARDAAEDAAADLQALLDAIDSGTGPQPAAADVAIAQARADSTAAAFQALPAQLGLEFDVNDQTVFIPNVMPDLGDTAPFNSFLTLFGQFFDHGLDLVSKGGSGTVYIPLQPDDPLYVQGSATNFMVLTRATNQPGQDGILGTADDIHEHRNETTPFIDLNQVYTSHESHQVFLREYVRVELDGVMRTVATGRMLESANGGPPTWADIKAQAREMLGIALGDLDVLRVPLLATDLYGNFEPDANGYAQLVTAGGLVAGDASAPVPASMGLAAGRAFLNDIAHSAAPGLVDHDRNPGTAPVATAADADDVAGNAIPVNMFGVATTYDNELLDKHFIVGDGRGNENIGLTAVHHVFHSEHNTRVDQIKAEILASGDVAFLNEWLLVPVGTNSVPLSGDGLLWNGERLFQAARFSTEMVYQHLVFEEFARLVSPDVDPFVFSNTVDIDPAIVAEFAHVVYRFGHSMLRETVDRLAADGQTSDDIGLIEAFLNPQEFVASGADAEAAAGAILRGMTRQVGNEIDEFLTDALRNNLVGLPLDLGAINIARGRDTGVPTLNEARRQFHEQTNDSALRPYDSWYDFALALKNPGSIINFVAAYGTHASITGATTLEAKRDAATVLVLGGAGAPADRLDFLNATGAWAGESLGGLNDVDFWIGGLAEKKMAFGGLLGSTFNFVFEVQMEKLQDGDRFYYLSRTQGMNLLNQLEADSFAELVMRNTDLGDPGATHLPSSMFLTPDYILELDRSRQKVADPNHADPILAAIRPLVERKDTDGDGIDDSLRYAGGDHVVIGGNDLDNTLTGGEGDDTLWGDDGDDRLEGGFGVDHLFGGAGNDVITDAGTDSGAGDVIHGDAGNEGDDWLEGGDSFDTLTGDNSELFFNSPIIGHDVLNGRGNDNDYDAESGDDIMFQGPGIQRNNGMAGFDWAIHKGEAQAAHSDLGIPIFVNQEANILRDRFDLVEGLSGWVHGDTLTGRDVVVGGFGENGAAAQPAPGSSFESYSNALLETGVARIAGLSGLVAHLGRDSITVAGKQHTFVVFDEAALARDASGAVTSIEDTAADILLGGGGSDVLQGKAGNDVIDGDRWLNVRIRISDAAGAEIGWSDNLGAKVFSAAGAELFGGRTLDRLMFDRTLEPGQLGIVREILDGDASDTAVDSAVYRGNRAEYEISFNEDGSVTVSHTAPAVGAAVDDGVDRLFNIETLVFADGSLTTAAPDLVGTELADVLTGGARPDRIFGLGGNDALSGLAGNDLLDGGAGNDTLNGGAGNDVLLGGLGVDVVSGGDGDDMVKYTIGGGADTVDGGAGLDTLEITGTGAANALAVAYDGVTLTSVAGVSVANVEMVRADLLGGIDTLTYTATTAGVTVNLAGGNASGFASVAGIENVTTGSGNDTLIGNTQANVLTGGAGNDLFVAVQNDGNDNYLGGGGADTYDLSGTAAPATVDLAAGTATSATTGTDTLSSIENIIGTQGADTIAGSTLANHIQGRGGNDTFIYLVGGGIDTIDGGSGIDTLHIAGISTTTLNAMWDGTSLLGIEGGTLTGVEIVRADLQGDADTLSYANTTAGVAVNLATGSASGFASIAGVEHLVGGSGNDLLVSAIGVDNSLSGGAGDDTFVVHESTDVVLELAGGGVDEVRSMALAFTLTDAQVENLAFIGNGDFTGTGNNAANAITGGAGNDALTGLGGNDTLLGGSGDDVLTGGLGNDVVQGGAGNDTILQGIGDGVDALEGGSGHDTLRLTGTAAANSLAVVFAAGALTSVGGNALTGIESVVIDLQDGVDTLSYAGTTEAITADTTGQASGIAAMTGIENVIGGSGNDWLAGAAGVANTLTGGGGDDVFVVHDTDDLVVEGAAEGLDEVRSMAGNYTLTSTNVENLSYAGTGNFVGAGNGAANVITGGDGADALSGLGGADTLRGGAGDDTLNGGAGNDTIAGGDGHDTIQYVVGDGADAVDGGAGLDWLNILGTAAANTLVVTFAAGALRSVAGGTVTGVEAARLDLLDGVDSLSYAGTNDAVTVDLAGVASGFASISGVENATGGNGDDLLASAPGVTNALTGGAGNDTFVVHETADTVSEAAGGGTRDEVLSFAATYAISNANVENLTFIGQGRFSGTGNNAANVLTGGADDDLLAGLLGDDMLEGNGGNDMLDGGNGNDRLNGGDGLDTLVGGAGNDALQGGTGNDSLLGGDGVDIVNGGIGDDVLNGEAGNDIFIFQGAFGRDRIDGFDAVSAGGQDRMDLSALGISAADFGARVTVSVTAGGGTLVTIGSESFLLVGVDGVGDNVVNQADFIFA